MLRHRKHILQDLVGIVISIIVAFFLVEAGLVENFINSFHKSEYLAIFIAGIFFTSVFTTAPAIVILATFTEHNNMFVVSLLGGLGAMVGDYIMFHFVKDRVSEDFKYIFNLSKKHRVPNIFKTKLFHRFAPFFGALIIASPLPDEIGIAILGLSHTSDRFFLFLSFVFNTGGILAIGLLTKFVI